MGKSKSRNPLGAGYHRAENASYNGGQRQDYIGVRLGYELRARAIDAAQQMGMPLSTWLRAVVQHALDYGLQGGVTDPNNAGFLLGRQLGMALAQQQVIDSVKEALEALPISYEEAIARFPDGIVPMYHPQR